MDVKRSSEFGDAVEGVAAADLGGGGLISWRSRAHHQVTGDLALAAKQAVARL